MTNRSTGVWDYLIVTASNDAQARAYRQQLELRQKLGVLSHFRNVMVVADPGGKRVGSGGSTLYCLLQIINNEWDKINNDLPKPLFSTLLNSVRVLIVHAGGDSRRLPAYGPAGKIFIPLPGEAKTSAGMTLFDRLISTFQDLPHGKPGCGQIVITAGDALLLFDASHVRFDNPGLTALACPATPEHASKHGVFCPEKDGKVRLYLQKPGESQQIQAKAVDVDGMSLLDIGVMSFDGALATAMLTALGVEVRSDGRLGWPAKTEEKLGSLGMDFYREICCAMGSEASAPHHVHQCRQSGSRWDSLDLENLFFHLKPFSFYVQSVPQCRFLHFGTTKQLISSGIELRQLDQSDYDQSIPLILNSTIRNAGLIQGKRSWIEGCDVASEVKLAGNNILVGIEIEKPISLPEGACIDMTPGTNREGQKVWFLRCYGINDTFKDSIQKGATLCNRSILSWLEGAQLAVTAVWDNSADASSCSLWNARIFPAIKSPSEIYDWVWMLDPARATETQKQSLRTADRYSTEEIALFANQDEFFGRRYRGSY